MTKALVTLVALYCCASVPTAHAQSAPAALLIYADGLKSGWTIGGWSKYSIDTPFADGSKPVTLNMEGWNAFTFQTQTPVSVEDFTTLTIVIHGGVKGKQVLRFSARLGDKVVSKEFTIKAMKGGWVRVETPLEKMKIKGGKFDTLYFNNASANKLDELYINYVLLTGPQALPPPVEQKR